MDVSTRMGNCWLTINTGSAFYRELYLPMQEQDDSVKRALNLILMAFARAEDEAYARNLSEAFVEVREMWGKKIKTFLKDGYQA